MLFASLGMVRPLQILGRFQNCAQCFRYDLVIIRLEQRNSCAFMLKIFSTQVKLLLAFLESFETTELRYQLSFYSSNLAMQSKE